MRAGWGAGSRPGAGSGRGRPSPASRPRVCAAGRARLALGAPGHGGPARRGREARGLPAQVSPRVAVPRSSAPAGSAGGGVRCRVSGVAAPAGRAAAQKSGPVVAVRGARAAPEPRSSEERPGLPGRERLGVAGGKAVRQARAPDARQSRIPWARAALGEPRGAAVARRPRKAGPDGGFAGGRVTFPALGFARAPLGWRPGHRESLQVRSECLSLPESQERGDGAPLSFLNRSLNPKSFVGCRETMTWIQVFIFSVKK